MQKVTQNSCAACRTPRAGGKEQEFLCWLKWFLQAEDPTLVAFLACDKTLRKESQRLRNALFDAAPMRALFVGGSGVNVFFRKMAVAAASSPVVEISQQGDELSIKTSTSVRTTNISFTVGQAFSESTVDGRACTVRVSPLGSLLTCNGTQSRIILTNLSFFLPLTSAEFPQVGNRQQDQL